MRRVVNDEPVRLDDDVFARLRALELFRTKTLGDGAVVRVFVLRRARRVPSVAVPGEGSVLELRVRVKGPVWIVRARHFPRAQFSRGYEGARDDAREHREAERDGENEVSNRK